MSKKKSQSINVVLLISLCVAITVIVVLSVFLIGKSGNSSPDSGGVTQSADDFNDENKTYGIDTPYCTVQYPEKWKQYLKNTESEENGVFRQTYYCVLNNKETELFSIYFGAVENTTVIGNIIHDGSRIPFSVSSAELMPNSGFSEEEKDIIKGMDYAVNTIIESVIALPNYVG